MGTSAEFAALTAHLGVDCDCPVCGFSWPGCQGACAAHVARNGSPGPFHADYNDDCQECLRHFELDDRYPRLELHAAPDESGRWQIWRLKPDLVDDPTSTEAFVVLAAGQTELAAWDAAEKLLAQETEPDETA